MSEIFKSDIFFFISSVGFVALGIIGIIIGIYIIAIARDIKTITKGARKQVESLYRVIEIIIEKIKGEEKKISDFIEWGLSYFKKTNKKPFNYTQGKKVKK